MAGTKVKLATSKGDITVELNDEKAPVTVENFLAYVNDGFFNGTIFHRVIKGFMVQGGGFKADMSQKETKPSIINEANNGLKNEKGTLSMARTNDPNSATCQFFINHADNAFLDFAGAANPGYAVFAKVVEGIEVVDAIAEGATARKGMYDDVPVETVTIDSAEVVTA